MKIPFGKFGAFAAMVAVVALAAGTTLAFWSDFDIITGNSVGAGKLQLVVEGGNGGAQETFDFGNMAPGEGSDRTRYLASNDGDSVPDGSLSLTLQNLADQENGCETNSEAVAEGATEAQAAAGNYSNAACNAETTSGGEFSQQANIKIEATDPTTAGNCGQAGSASLPWNEVYNGGLASAFGSSITLGDVAPGEGRCVRMTVSLPTSANNASQGDSSTFDVRFDLAQI